jgi:hypothetical protein
MKLCRIIFLFLIFVSSSGDSQSIHPTTKIDSEDYHIYHHTCSRFNHFWASFQYYLKTNNKEALKKIIVLPNPSLAAVFSTFNRFAYCDTNKMTREDSILDTIQISRKNFDTYYPVLFSRYIKNMLVGLTIPAIEKDNNEMHAVFYKLAPEDSICNKIYLHLNLSDSKEYKPC